VNEPISYVSEDATRRDARPPRSAGMWAKLLIVWSVGFVVWALYVSAILYAFFRVML
jgi:hypothetical protein